jgi:hypothetical protein
MRRSAVAVGLTMSAFLSTVAAAAPAQAAGAVEVIVRPASVSTIATLRPGLHKFATTFRRSDGAFALIQPRAGYSLKEYRRDATAALLGSGRTAVRAERRLAENSQRRSGVYGLQGQTLVVWQRVHRGRLWVASSLQAGIVEKVTVKGSRTSATAPDARTITARDGAIAAPVSLPPTGVLQFRNRGTEQHHVAVLRLKPGKTSADVAAYITSVIQDDPDNPTALEDPVDIEGSQATPQPVEPGDRIWLRYSLDPGAYVVVRVRTDLIAGETHVVEELRDLTVG